MAGDSFQEKTEQPTEKRLEDAKKKGQVAQSKELSTCLIILFLSIPISLIKDSILKVLEDNAIKGIEK